MATDTSTTTKQQTIELKWFSVLAEHRGARSEELPVSGALTGQELLDRLSEDFPLLEKYRRHIRLAVNRKYCGPETMINPGDEVAFITPVSGG